jgi:hypothetical protein
MNIGTAPYDLTSISPRMKLIKEMHCKEYGSNKYTEKTLMGCLIPCAYCILYSTISIVL